MYVWWCVDCVHVYLGSDLSFLVPDGVHAALCCSDCHSVYYWKHQWGSLEVGWADVPRVHQRHPDRLRYASLLSCMLETCDVVVTYWLVGRALIIATWVHQFSWCCWQRFSWLLISRVSNNPTPSACQSLFIILASRRRCCLAAAGNYAVWRLWERGGGP